jgi:hypothetical protein
MGVLEGSGVKNRVSAWRVVGSWVPSGGSVGGEPGAVGEGEARTGVECREGVAVVRFDVAAGWMGSGR